jgi:dipeptidyl aminopeptidase/acylaminoacyl peptidase
MRGLMGRGPDVSGAYSGNYHEGVKFLAGFALAVCAHAAAPFTLDQVLGAAFPTDLTAAPAGGAVAWVSNALGVRNVMVAEPPLYRARKITAFNADDGQEIGELAWTPDGSGVVFVRGGGPNGAGEAPNPAENPKGAEQTLWFASVRCCMAQTFAEGSAPTVSPKGTQVAFLRKGQIWLWSFDWKSAAKQAFVARGTCGRPVWSPDGTRIAFTSERGDHGFIGVYDIQSQTLRFLDPSTDYDLYPAWSPDGREIAFVRIPSSGMRPVREPHREGEPWSIRVADAGTGEGRQVWRAKPGRGSVFRELAGEEQLFWMEGGRIAFPWEGDGWTHLYAVPGTAHGTALPLLLTPGDFEVEDVALQHGGNEIVFSSNQGDIDRRHLWRITNWGPPFALTSGDGIECQPVVTSSGAVALLHSDAREPLRVAMLGGGGAMRDVDPSAIPANFPAANMVTPQPVIFKSSDGLEIHGQLFLPPHASGRAPTAVFFHGGSRRQMLLGWHYMYYYSNAYALNQYLANSGYAVLSVNYRSGIGYGLDFREALRYGASGGSEYLDVKAAAEYLRTRSDVDPRRIAAWGGSYGGYLVAMALARSSDLYRAGVDFHGVHDWAKELGIPAGEPDYKIAFNSSPMAFLDTWRSPVLLIQGDDDRNVHFNQTVMLADALRRRGVEVEELIFPDEIHDFLLWRSWRDAYRAAAEFLGKKLGK